MKPFDVVPELRVGAVTEVAGTAIKIELDGTINELTRSYGGRVYAIGQYASVVKIHFGRRILLAYVRLLRMRSDIERELGKPIPPPSEDSRLLEADLFGEGVWNDRDGRLEFTRGVRNYPLPGQAVHLSTSEELRKTYEAAELVRSGDCDPMLRIGSYLGAETTACYANLDKLIGLHCAVLGSTGTGKSGTVAAIVHSLIEHRAKRDATEGLRPRIIVIDPHGEYAAAFGSRAVVFRAYEVLAGKDKGTLLRLPYWVMSAEEFRELVIGKTEYEATSENNIVYKALTHARLVTRGWAEPAREWSGQAVQGRHPAENRATNKEYLARIATYDPDTPDPFSLDEFVAHIAKEQGMRVKAGGKWEEMSPSDFKSHASVLDKLAVLRVDPRLKFMMAEYEKGQGDLGDVLQQFVGEVQAGDQVDVRIIDISGLPNEVAGPLAASVARLLFQYKVWQTREERERDPVLLVCEEAHRYVPDTGLAEYGAAQKAVRRIAKEGRKYGIGLMLVSQRPADVERTVLSQCNTWLIMRLTNAADQEHVNRMLPDSLAGLSRLLPSLGRQEALFVGEAAAIPSRIVIRELSKEQLPDSGDISFVAGWSHPPVDRQAIERVVMRWRRERGAEGPS
jgi:hypothetical protein